MDLSFIYNFIDQDILNQAMGTIILILFITGRITKKQFKAEQKKIKGMIPSSQCKSDMEEEVIGIIGKGLDLADKVPGLNFRIPLINQSIPKIAKGLLKGTVGILGDVMHNAPVVGTNVKSDNHNSKNTGRK